MTAQAKALLELPVKATESIEDRKTLARLEMQERISLAKKEQAQIKSKIEEYRKFPSERNEAVITTNFLPALRLLEEQEQV